jgi:DnaJ-class molecular chaperone
VSTNEHVCVASTVLGVPRSASAEELRERYRALALVFHPDKHASDGDERLRDVAAKRHLEVQKAYEGAHVLRFLAAVD